MSSVLPATHLTCRPLRRRARQWRPCRGASGPGSCCGSGKCPALRGKNYLSQPQTITPGYYTPQPVLWIRIGSNADPDWLQCRLAFYLNADLSHTKLNFYMKNILKVDNRSKIQIRRYKSLFWKAENQVYLLILANSMLLDPDPDYQNGSGSKTSKWMRI